GALPLAYRSRPLADELRLSAFANRLIRRLDTLENVQGRFTGDGQRFIAWGRSPSISDARTGDVIAKLEDHTGGAPQNVGLNNVLLNKSDTRVGGWASGGSAVRMWDSRTGALVARLEGHADQVSVFALDHGARFVTVAANDPVVRLWDGESGTLIATLEG